jgi:deoxyadenosine/deoxycytidine kinase
MTIFCLEGNVGAGKEILIQFFKRYFKDDLIFFEDSVYNWDDHQFLKEFYKDPKRWAMTMEIYSTTQKCKRFKEFNTSDNQIVITRRSPMSDKECFVKACVQMGFMTQKEFQIYESVFQTFQMPKYNGVIFLRSNTNKCLENIVSKKLGLEKMINFDYIQKLNKNYENWIIELKKQNVNILEIDMERFRDLDGNERNQETLLDIILTRFPEFKTHLKQLYGPIKKDSPWTTVNKKKKVCDNELSMN